MQAYKQKVPAIIMSSSLETPPPLKDRTKMKRKRKCISSQDLEVKSHMTNKNPKSDLTHETNPKTKLFPLTGWTLAVSTAIHDPNNQLNDDNVHKKNPIAINKDNNNTSISTVLLSPTYQELARIGRDLGAQISGQVHRRVSALVCGSSCCETQRFRKARKLGILILRAEWLYDCQQNDICLPWQDYNISTSISSTTMTNATLNLSTKSTIETKDESLEQKLDISTSNLTVVVNDDTITTEDQESLTNATGWTNAESLGCCCVCHETRINEDTCPWCAECRMHRAG
jgi:BRCA1 C Terminus (BRCT) domain